MKGTIPLAYSLTRMQCDQPSPVLTIPTRNTLISISVRRGCIPRLSVKRNTYICCLVRHFVTVTSDITNTHAQLCTSMSSDVLIHAF